MRGSVVRCPFFFFLSCSSVKGKRCCEVHIPMVVQVSSGWTFSYRSFFYYFCGRKKVYCFPVGNGDLLWISVAYLFIQMALLKKKNSFDRKGNKLLFRNWNGWLVDACWSLARARMAAKWTYVAKWIFFPPLCLSVLLIESFEDMKETCDVASYCWDQTQNSLRIAGDCLRWTRNKLTRRRELCPRTRIIIRRKKSGVLQSSVCLDFILALAWRGLLALL